MKHRKLIALLAAVVTTFAIWQILSTQAENREAQMDYRQVIVAVSEIKKGDVIQRGELELKKVPRQYTPEGALEEGKDVIGKVAQSGILPGEILTAARLADPENGQAGLAYKIPENGRAVTLNVDTESGMSGMVLPGDEVDLMISLSGAAALGVAPPDGLLMMTDATGNFSTFYLLEKVRVLACGAALSKEAAGQIEEETGKMYDSVTLSVSREEALQIEFYTYLAKNNNGAIRLTLRPASDTVKPSDKDAKE